MKKKQQYKFTPNAVTPKPKEPLKKTSENWDKLAPLIAKRLSLGIKAIEVAATYGVSPARISLIESGAIPITDEVLGRYAAALAECEKLIREKRTHERFGGAL